MGGAGKTTLARTVYKSAGLKEHFDVFAFVSISQQFEVLNVLKEITAQAMGIKRRERVRELDTIDDQARDLEKKGKQESAEILHNLLEGKRYLIVLDDVWRMDTWAVIQHALPDSGNGSKVLLTTRNSDVAKQVNKPTYVHLVRLLNEEESEQLFFLKAFPSYESINANTRQELDRVGRNLDKKCHGLPLALVILGSHLSKNLHFDTWSKMEQCLDWEVTGKRYNMQQIIALSYDDMPSRSLKDCFLYIASFPEDFEIEADDLTRRWIAENFVRHRHNQTLEDIAYGCLEELVQRSMVHNVYWNDKRGRIHSVQMHDVLREWAIQKALEEGFLKLCKSGDDVSWGTPAYRLSLIDYFDDRIFLSAPNMRSMLGFSLARVTLKTQRFLGVLYMVDTNLEEISQVLGHLIHLRYIGLIRCKNVVLPSSIGRLLNLQYIDLTGTRIPCIPKSLWDIPTLRHVEVELIDMQASFGCTTIRVEEQSELQTLLYVSYPLHEPKIGMDSVGWIRLKKYLIVPLTRTILRGAEQGEMQTRRIGWLWHRHKNKIGTESTRWIRMKKHLMRMAQLRTLVLDSLAFLPVDVLISLKEYHRLEFLHLLVWESIDVFPGRGQLPQNLRYLALLFPGTWNSWHADLLPNLGGLQNLLNLTLYAQDNADGPVMSSPAGAFPRLRYLILGGVQANKLRFQSGTMPKLAELRFCYSYMTTVPDGLFDLLSLEKLELYSMLKNVPRETRERLEQRGYQGHHQSLIDKFKIIPQLVSSRCSYEF